MTGRVTALCRYPIKGHGREFIEAVTLAAGQTMPWDRVWAIAHEESDADGSEWVPCQHFSRGSKAPLLSAISLELDEANARVRLSHPALPDLEVSPDTEGEALVAWAGPLIPENRAQSARVVRSQTTGFTDSDFPSITICNMSSHRAVSQRVGQDLSADRWRANVFVEDLGPWEEWEWMDREVRLGGAVLRVQERTDRCLQTHNNPKTGKRDANILAALDTWGHRDFTVRAEVVEGGPVAVGDSIALKA